MVDAEGTRHNRPWRKPAAAAKAERSAARATLGESGVDLVALTRALEAQDFITKTSATARETLQPVVTALIQAATNARPRAEIDAATASLEMALERLALHTAAGEQASARGGHPPGRPMRGGASARLAVMHRVVPRLYVGGWAALLNDCEALRARGVTHVVSVVSADKRQLPAFIKAHYHVLVDDREEAAVEMAGHFARICSFVSRALQSGGTCYIHCGAGISRAPTAACAYLVYAHRLRAADALMLVRHGRPCARPNVGFVRVLHDWEKLVLASAPAFRTDEGTPMEVFGSSHGPLEEPRGSTE